MHLENMQELFSKLHMYTQFSCNYAFMLCVYSVSSYKVETLNLYMYLFNETQALYYHKKYSRSRLIQCALFTKCVLLNAQMYLDVKRFSTLIMELHSQGSLSPDC